MKRVAALFFLLSAISCTNSRVQNQTLNSPALPKRTIASLEEQVAKLNPKQPTVCTVTINSENEKQVFQTYLKDFNFIELADGERDGWLKRACAKNIQCDILLVSGHFGGTFFGKSEYKLSMTDLEESSCEQSCDGIIKRPKEKFLMGCNTLAGKAKDTRSPEEYVRVLMADGLTRQQAQQIAA